MTKSNSQTYQEFTRTTAIYPKDKNIEYLILGLASESGEVAGVLKKYIRDGFSKEELKEKLIAECGDIFWYLARICDEVLEMDMEEVMKVNQVKLEDRKKRDVLKGSGDYR
jgi:NTP pyrophosphatase (non-canonical NTP hydrolase)